MLTNAASNLSPSVDFAHDIFSMELIFNLLISDNIMYHDNKQIIDLLHLEKIFKGSMIDDEQHEALLQGLVSKEKPKLRDPFPKNISRMENHFKFQDTFKKMTNSSSWKYESIDIFSIK